MSVVCVAANSRSVKPCLLPDKAMDMEIKPVPWWHRRSRMERSFVVAAVALLAACVGLAVGLVAVVYRDYVDSGAAAAVLIPPQPPNASASASSSSTASESSKDGSSDFCLTRGCVLTASDILRNMDSSAGPCHDFYQFACGGFSERTTIPDDRTRVSSFSVLGDELLTQVRMLLESEGVPGEPRPFRMARDVYRSCMDKERIEEAGTRPLLDILRRLGGWPVLEPAWNDTGYVWYEQVYRLRKAGYSVDYFVDFSVTTDLKNSSWRVLDLDQPGLGLSREYLIKGVNDEDVQAYLDYMVDVATFLGGDTDPDAARKEMTDVLLFEMALANFSLPREERRNASKLYNPMRIRDLTKLDPDTPWLEYINNILTEDIIQVTEDEMVIVDVPSYLEQFSTHLRTVSARVQANYMMWRVAAASMKYLSEEARKIALKFSNKLTGKSEETPRWHTCVNAAKGSLANAVGSMYVRKYFQEDSRQAALEMVHDIRAEFDHILQQVDWMDQNTKTRAKEKASGIVEHIGYPPELLDAAKLNDLYSGLEVNEDDYLGNALNMTVFGTNYAFSKLREKVNKTDWIRHGRPAVVNAFYSPLENSIQFPAGILQGIFFSSDRPRYMNYGAIGWVIGHEITHGFDDQGRQFDMEGNLVDWWEPTTKANYLHKAQCIVQQYGNYTLPHLELNINGINTQGENIADNGGIKEAYRAYNKWVERHGEEPLLPGLGSFSQRQMFWISAANVWCAKYRDKALKLRVMTGVHSPDSFRVQGPFSNMAEFARDFSCPPGSPMNPVKKCEVW